jgi:aconitase B
MPALLAAAGESHPTANDTTQAVTGTILSVSYATGDILICQDSGSLLALYGLNRARLRDIGAGDRVSVTFGENLEVSAIERIDL